MTAPPTVSMPAVGGPTPGRLRAESTPVFEEAARAASSPLTAAELRRLARDARTACGAAYARLGGVSGELGPDHVEALEATRLALGRLRALEVELLLRLAEEVR